MFPNPWISGHSTDLVLQIRAIACAGFYRVDVGYWIDWENPHCLCERWWSYEGINKATKGMQAAIVQRSSIEFLEDASELVSKASLWLYKLPELMPSWTDGTELT
jgi:hypothetical protein